MLSDLSQRFSNASLWGLRLAPAGQPRARQVERRWRWPALLALVDTIPAFYIELLQADPTPLARLAYALAALVTATALGHTAWRSGAPARHLLANPLDLTLVAGLLLAAALPPSSGSVVALQLRLAVAGMTLVRMVWALQHLITRGSLAQVLLLAGAVLGLCGLGYRWLEPTTPTFAEGLWLAFVTAGTVGYGDVVPTSPAAKIFSAFVVLLGFGVLSLVTAAVAAKWVEVEERTIEREILRDVHRQIDSLRQDIAALREDLACSRARLPAADDGHRGPPQPPPGRG